MPGLTLGLLICPSAGELSNAAARRQFSLELARCGQIAEEFGFDEFWLEEPAPTATPSVGPFALLGHLAARTTMAIGAVLPATSERVPSITAKAIASLDVTTSGRALAALSPSRGASENEVARFSPRDLEAAFVIDTLLREQAASVRGDFYVAEHAWNEPRVAARPTPLYLVLEHPAAHPGDHVRREFVQYVTGREVLLPAGAVVGPETAPRRTVIAVDAVSTPAIVASGLGNDESVAGGVVLQWRGEIDAARLAALVAVVRAP